MKRNVLLIDIYQLHAELKKAWSQGEEDFKKAYKKAVGILNRIRNYYMYGLLIGIGIKDEDVFNDAMYIISYVRLLQIAIEKGYKDKLNVWFLHDEPPMEDIKKYSEIRNILADFFTNSIVDLLEKAHQLEESLIGSIFEDG